MVLRKPYAFLIKYFKLINFILSALLIYLAYRTYNIINFFNEYILNNYSGNYFKGFSEQYVSPFVYLILIIIFIGTLAIYLLLKYKNKPAKLYLTNLIYMEIWLREMEKGRKWMLDNCKIHTNDIEYKVEVIN